MAEPVEVRVEKKLPCYRSPEKGEVLTFGVLFLFRFVSFRFTPCRSVGVRGSRAPVVSTYHYHFLLFYPGRPKIYHTISLIPKQYWTYPSDTDSSLVMGNTKPIGEIHKKPKKDRKNLPIARRTGVGPEKGSTATIS